MIHSLRFTCVLDTNVIYPIDIRDLLFWFASYDLFTPKWSKHIFSEWENIMKLKEIPEVEIKKRISKAQMAFPDQKDRHVLAAAIKTNANVIVTNNIKDFPNDYLSSFGLTAKTADDFLTDTIDLNNELAVQAFRDLVLNRKNPNLDKFEILDRFRKNGLIDTANYLHALL